jgi:hypothetical protein
MFMLDRTFDVDTPIGGSDVDTQPTRDPVVCDGNWLATAELQLKRARGGREREGEIARRASVNGYKANKK